jgi:hypothetical protein
MISVAAMVLVLRRSEIHAKGMFRRFVYGCTGRHWIA